MCVEGIDVHNGYSCGISMWDIQIRDGNPYEILIVWVRVRVRFTVRISFRVWIRGSVSDIQSGHGNPYTAISIMNIPDGYLCP